MRFRVLILGGYGHFGGRIARTLAQDPDMALTIAGRDGARAREFAAALGGGARAAALDLADPGFAEQLAGLRPRLVIHAAGPFLHQDYRVARAAIAAGAHYVDLADARGFVCGIVELEPEARMRKVLVLSGASSVPALSSAVVDHYSRGYARMERIDIGISPGNRTPRGLATVAAVLGSVGRPFRWREESRSRIVHGWQRLARFEYAAPVGRRWLAACDVPDLALLPLRYGGVDNVQFRAGLELPILHLGLWCLSWLARLRLVRDWSAHAERLKAISEWFSGRGHDAGAMHVSIDGTDAAGLPRSVRWQLLALYGDGPQVPCTAAIVVAKKLAHGGLRERGAKPCMGVFTLDEFLAELQDHAIRTVVTQTSSSQPS